MKKPRTKKPLSTLYLLQEEFATDPTKTIQESSQRTVVVLGKNSYPRMYIECTITSEIVVFFS